MSNSKRKRKEKLHYSSVIVFYLPVRSLQLKRVLKHIHNSESFHITIYVD